MRKCLICLAVSVLLTTGCQQTTVDETANLFDAPAIYFDSWGMFLQLDPGYSGVHDDTTRMNSDYSNGELFFYKDVWLNSGRVVLHFDANVNTYNNSVGMHLLWSGEAGKRTLTVFGNQYQPLPMQRPPRIAFTVPAAGNYRITLDTVRLRYDITGPGAITDENTLQSVHLLSSHRSFTGLGPATQLVFMGDSYRIAFTNLVPGVPFSFRLVKNGNTNEALSKAADNPFTLNNGLFDAEVGKSGISPASFVPTSEVGLFYFNPVSRSYRVDMSAIPQYADGYGDPGFYGPPVLSNTNAASLQDIRTVSIRDMGEAWYIAVDGTFTGTVGLPRRSAGVRFVLFIDDPADGSGTSGAVRLYDHMPLVTIPAGCSVEYVLTMESDSYTTNTQDGPGMLMHGYVKMYGPITGGVTNICAQSVERRLPVYTGNPAGGYQDGYFLYGDVYEIVIPKIRHGVGSVLPVESMNVCLVSWNAWTYWGNTANTNHPSPIVYSIPSSPSTNTLPGAGMWIGVP